MGECDACVGRYPHAWCCSDQSLVEMSTGLLDPETEEFLTARGFVIEDHRLRVTIKQMCKQYDTPTKKCRIYEGRPKTCRDFPVHPVQVYVRAGNGWVKHCSYDWDLNTSRDIDADLVRLMKVMELE